LFTSDQLAFQRELVLPITVTIYSELRGRLISAMASSSEKEREGAETLGGVENSLKVYIGRVKALGDPAFTSRLAAAETELKAKSAGNTAIGNPWGDIAKAMGAYRNFYVADRFSLPSGDLFNYAITLVRAGSERGKPNAERMAGYSDSALPLVEKRLLDEKPIYPWLDQLYMEWSLSKAREYLGADDPQTKLLLGKESPEGLAARLVAGTKLADPALRRALWEGGQAAIEASTDPMIVYARSVDANDRALQKRYDEEVDAPLTAAQARLADARFAAYGDSVYPDATFTLRISYGKVAGWQERGQMVPSRTTLGGTFDRATGASPFDLPPAFIANAKTIDPDVTYNFVTTHDIIGGNYGYDGTIKRAVVVSAAAVQEALEKIYPAPHLVAELKGK
ncbi:MAG TPA: S46 family peptidase, partial [Sphingomicrobium sp.]|nr:S46 family peptidase [Sphingomicrobium sp.]